MDFLSTVSIPLPSNAPGFDAAQLVTELLVGAPLILGFLLLRNAKSNFLYEIAAAALLVAATVIPSNLSSANVGEVGTLIANRWQLIGFLIGFAFIQDKQFLKVIVGIIILIGSGILVIPGVIH